MPFRDLDFARLDAIAKEHGGALAFLRGHDADGDSDPQLEAMVLSIREQENAISFHLADYEGGERVCFILRVDDFEMARELAGD